MGFLNDFPQGVRWYTKGQAVIPVYFPEGYCDCRHCTRIGTNNILEVAYCKLTGEVIERKDLGKRGKACPVVFDETEF